MHNKNYDALKICLSTPLCYQWIVALSNTCAGGDQPHPCVLCMVYIVSDTFQFSVQIIDCITYLSSRRSNQSCIVIIELNTTLKSTAVYSTGA